MKHQYSWRCFPPALTLSTPTKVFPLSPSLSLYPSWDGPPGSSPSSPVYTSSVLHFQFFQPEIPAVWGCAPSPVGAAPCGDAPLKDFSSLVVSQMGEFEHWNRRSQAELPPWSPRIRLQLCPLVPVGYNLSPCTEHSHSASSDLGQV